MPDPSPERTPHGWSVGLEADPHRSVGVRILGRELVGPLETFDQAGYEVDFATPHGKRPIPLPPSMDPDYIDPPLGKSVTSVEVAQKTKDLDASSRYDKPIDISGWVPERPYWSSPTLLRDMEGYYGKLDALGTELAKYDAILLVGGSGPIVDIANNDRVHALILSFLKAGKPIGAECYGVTALAFARDLTDRKSIIWGKHVTGHCKEYDYKDGTGLHGHGLQHGPAAVPARVHPPRRHRPRGAATTATSATRPRSSSTTRSSPAAPPRTPTSPARRWSRSSRRA